MGTQCGTVQQASILHEYDRLPAGPSPLTLPLSSLLISHVAHIPSLPILI
jgi:hypothetical protein